MERGMNSPDRTPTETSDCSSVVDLPCTYNVSQSVWLQESSPPKSSEDFCSTLTSASSLTSLKNTVVTMIISVLVPLPQTAARGSRKNSCDSNEELQLENEKSQLMLQSSDSFIVTQQSSATLNSLHNLERKQGLDDVQIRSSLDAFYEQSSWRVKNDSLSHRFSEKMSHLSKKQHLYSLRSFQLGKIVLNQEGEKVLQNYSREENKNIDPVPGLSKDVAKFIMDKKPPHD
ncbi:shieldin complex subunit 1 isoform X1 [Dendrobates tinctorius]|uniref:shieldin complex subunit 1 isoform X1 n=1 Tax=Dendrobates tinctorius TaxID=92724 RepID=UPI003CCA3EFB